MRLAKEGFSPAFRATAVPLVGSLSFTCGAVSLLCRLPSQPSLSWLDLILRTLLYVGIAVCIHAAVLLALSKAFREHIELSPQALIAGSWLCAAWMPLLVLLRREGSIWMAFVPPLIVAPVILFLLQWNAETQDRARRKVLHAEREVETPGLFRVDDSPSFLRMVLPAVAIAAAMEAGAGALALGYDIWAGLLFAFCAVALAWSTPKSMRLETQPSNFERQGVTKNISAMRNAAIVAVCTGAALLPFLKHGGRQFLGVDRRHKLVAASKTTAPRTHSGGAYSGVVLLLPPKPQKPIVAPVAVRTNDLNGHQAKPVVILFDGVYWYFQPPKDRPEPDAQVVRGNPTKVNIRSKDWFPILMEAHQYLGSSIKMNCCRAMRVQLLNADRRPGSVRLEVILRDTTATGLLKTNAARAVSFESISSGSRVSLGSVLVPSSRSEGVVRETGAAGPPGDETLSFPFPAESTMKQFDEITIIFRPSEERQMMGTRTAIEQFVLIP